MLERAPERPAVFTIPAHRSFADALAAGLIQRFGKDPLGLARGRILLPNNRAVRAVTEAFVRASGSGLLLPRLIAVGDPELDERIGGALEPIDEASAVPPAIDPLERLLTLASVVRAGGSAEAVRPAAGLPRALHAPPVQGGGPPGLRRAAGRGGGAWGGIPRERSPRSGSRGSTRRAGGVRRRMPAPSRSFGSFRWPPFR